MELGEIITYWVQYRRENCDSWTTCQPAYSSLEGAQAREEFVQSTKQASETRIVKQVTTNMVY